MPKERAKASAKANQGSSEKKKAKKPRRKSVGDSAASPVGPAATERAGLTTEEMAVDFASMAPTPTDDPLYLEAENQPLQEEFGP